MEILTCEMKSSLKYLSKELGERLDLPSDLAAISRDRRLASLDLPSLSIHSSDTIPTSRKDSS